jgi:multiple sugar transport system ATP-binding protein
MHVAELDELAADAGLEDLPSHGDGQQVVARLSAESRARPGADVELSIDTTRFQLFDETGARLSAA